MSSPEPVLELDQVIWRTGQAPLSLRIAAGEAVLLAGGDAPDVQGLDEIVQGLDDPLEGTVRFLGSTWAARSPYEASRARGRIGWVPGPDGASWVSNLDLDENVTLPAQIHGQRTRDEAYGAADRLARQFGLPGLERIRPAWAPETSLRRLTWVRALLARPRLLLLDRPEHGEEDSGARRAFTAEVERLRGGGCAVLWIEGESPSPARDGVSGLIVVNWPPTPSTP